MNRHKILYTLSGVIITLVSLVLIIVYIGPSLAQDDVFLPIVQSGISDHSVVDSSNTRETSQINSLGIPLLPTTPPDKLSPTGTPVFTKGVPAIVTPEAINPKTDPPIEADLSPELVEAEKASIVIQYPNGQQAKILAGPDDTDKVKEYFATLPVGTMLVTIVPPVSLMGNQLPTPDVKNLPKEDIVITLTPLITEPALPPSN
jgi:hypothetical protein